MRAFVIVGVALVLAARADPPGKDAERIAALIRQLGDDDFVAREAASKKLEAVGEFALVALRKASSDGDAEVRRRAARAVRVITHRVTERELKALQGTWSLVSYEVDGKPIKGEDKGHVFTFKGDRWSIRDGGAVFQAGTVERIEPTGKVNAIDLLITEGGNVGLTALSVYAIEKDSLKYVNTGDPRPREFGTKPGDGRHFLTFRRVKP